MKVESKLIDELNLSSGDNNNITPKIIENTDNSIIKDDTKISLKGKIQIKKEEELLEDPSKSLKTINEENSSIQHNTTNNIEEDNIPIDWKPQKQCYFCVDGKLLTVNEKGELVAESGSAQNEANLANHVRKFNFY